MARLAVFSLLLSTALVAVPALAADYNVAPGLRTGYAADWNDGDDPLSFELGLRYWYSWGAQNFNVGPAALNENDRTQTVEGQFRINDASTRFYAKGLAGTSFLIDGNSSGGPAGQPSAVSDGRVSYLGADLGYSWLGDAGNGTGAGPLIGYMYWNDSPNFGRAEFDPTPTSGDSRENDIAINALRLGFGGRANLGNAFDVTAELAGVPYAKIDGTLGAYGIGSIDTGTTTITQSSAADIHGWGYGAMGELMVGFHPTDALTLRLGGRAWYLQGRSDTSFNTTTVNNTAPTTVTGTQTYINTDNPWSLLRYGLVGELTYNF